MTHKEFESHPYEDILFVWDEILAEKEEKNRDSMISAAFTAYLMGARPKKTFYEFTKELKLVKEEPIQDKKKAIEEAYKKAGQILKMDRG